MEQYSRKDFIRITGISAAALCSFSMLSSCSGVQRKDLASALSDAAPVLLNDNVRRILDLAVLAPSGHNTQPWTVRLLSSEKMIIGTDKTRQLPKVDPQNRECILSIGAFIENLTIAAGIYGYAVSIKVTAGSPFDEEITEIILTKDKKKGSDPSHIISRRTVRKGYLSKEISGGDFRYISQNSPESIFLASPSSSQGKYLADATIEANILQAQRNDAQEELSRWIRFSNADARRFRNGLTTESMEIQGMAGFFVRQFFNAQTVRGESFRKQTVDLVRQQVASCGGWILITSRDSSVSSLIDTGRQFQRMFLRIRDKSIAIHPMTQILEEKPFCAQAAKDLGIQGNLQFVLRTGYLQSYPDPVSIRMPVDWIVKK
ncbi:MAG: Acg family FMN-binding oxidoreductase [Spirochaetota bacterium]